MATEQALPPMAAPSPSPFVQQGSCRVTDTQVAFMVECYLRDSNFIKTLDQFRSEAETVLQSLKSVPKGARSLSAILNEYVVLKEQQIALNQEKARADVLFKGLQEVLSVYHSGNQTVHNRALPLPPISPGAIPHSSAKSEQIANTASGPVGPASKDQRSSSTLCKRVRSNETSTASTEVPNYLEISNGDVYSTVDTAKKPRRSNSAMKASSPNPSITQVVPFSKNNPNLRSDLPVRATVIQPATPPTKVEHMLTHRQTPMVSTTPSNSKDASESPPPNPAHSQNQFFVTSPNNNKVHSLNLRSQTSVGPDSKPTSNRKVNRGGYNRKCRLLDFSSSPKSSRSAVGHSRMPNLHQSNSTAHKHPIQTGSPATYGETSSSSSSPTQTSSESLSQPCDVQTQVDVDVDVSTTVHDITPCSNSDLFSFDGLSLDDLFDVELDTDLFSQLEDLQAIRDMRGLIDVSESSTQLIVGDENSTKLCAAKLHPSQRSVLTEKINLLGTCKVQLDDIFEAQETGIRSYSTSLQNHSKTSHKHGSSALQLRDKENVPLLAPLSSIQASKNTSPEVRISA